MNALQVGGCHVGRWVAVDDHLVPAAAGTETPLDTLKSRLAIADTPAAQMNWTFEKRDEHITICRVEESCTLIVTPSDGAARTQPFPDTHKLLTFQRDMETFLVNTGWTFVKFYPERRSGRDRRGFPRLNERRRWWTDGVELARVVWGR